jgi:4'-phosphopantetheinyl transferase
MSGRAKTAALITEPLPVDLWSLRLPALVTPYDVAQLSPAERQRASRLHGESDRVAFIAARAALRRCLAGRLGQPPDEVRIYSRRGFKPTFADLPPMTDLSVSHDGGRMLIAICHGARVGVDLQQMEPIDLELAATACSEAELATLTALPRSDQARAFARLWTRKEAVIKATGIGLAIDLKTIEVSLDTPPRLLRYDGQKVEDWTLISLDLDPAWEAALAVETRGRPLTLRRRNSL